MTDKNTEKVNRLMDQIRAMAGALGRPGRLRVAGTTIGLPEDEHVVGAASEDRELFFCFGDDRFTAQMFASCMVSLGLRVSLYEPELQ